MIIQIFGTKKCKDTKKAERFFKERKIQIQMVDLAQKALSKGEMNRIAQAVGLDNMIDPTSKRYEDLGLKYMKFDLQEKLLEEPLILKTPIVRQQQKATLGYQPEVWKEWLK